MSVFFCQLLSTSPSRLLVMWYFFKEFSTNVSTVFYQALDIHLATFVIGTLFIKWRCQQKVFRHNQDSFLPSRALNGLLKGYKHPVMEPVLKTWVHIYQQWRLCHAVIQLTRIVKTALTGRWTLTSEMLNY